MLDHVTLPVASLARGRAFYLAALAPLGITLLYEVPGAFCGFGKAPKAFFWIGERPPGSLGVHVAFTAATRREVEAFHRAALAAGGTDHGAPGIRPHYHANYYGAFVRDPDGHNIEAVCHLPQEA
jgi:catechol 2,3-dioxygenase-like lactoylglutathione lyase family enzyme